LHIGVPSHHFGARLVARGRGGVILVTSGAAWAGGGNIAAYGATKAFDLVLAEALWAEGQLSRARKLEEAVVSGRRALYGEAHYDTLKALGKLASTHGQQGDLAEAKRLQEEVAAGMRALYGDDAYRFMRARADSIAATLLLQIERSKDPDPTKWVLAKEYVRDLRVVAARKGMTEFPHLCFVGAEYVANLSHRARTLIFESSANVLSSRVNTRDDSRLRSMAAVAKTGGLGM